MARGERFRIGGVEHKEAAKAFKVEEEAILEAVANLTKSFATHPSVLRRRHDAHRGRVIIHRRKAAVADVAGTDHHDGRFTFVSSVNTDLARIEIGPK